MVNDGVRSWLGILPYYIKQVGNAGDMAVMASSASNEAIELMNTKYWKNQIAPRGIWKMMKYKPSDYASSIKCPVMITMAEFDHEITDDTTTELVEKIPNCNLKTYPLNHFGVYDRDLRDQISSDQFFFFCRLI